MTWATLKTDGEFAVHEGIPELEDLQAAVGGYVQVLEVKSEITMWCNEDVPEKFMGVPRREWENPLATWLVQDAGINDVIAKDVAFTGGPDEEGETTGLTEEQVEYLRGKVLSRAVIAGDFSGMVQGREATA